MQKLARVLNRQNLTEEKVSRYLIFFILAVLPLERIPALHLYWHSFEVTVRLSQLAGLVLIIINLPLLWRRRGQLLKAPWLWLMLFLFFTVISTALSFELKRAAMVTAFIAFDLILAWAIANRFEAEKLGSYIKILLGSALAVTLFGLYQFVGDLAGLSNQITGLLPRYTKDIFGFPRIQSTGYEPLFFANYLLIPTILAAALYLWGIKKLWPLLLFFTVIWLTLSRGAYAGLAAGLLLLLVWAWWQKKSKRKLAAIVGCVIVSIGLAMGAIALAPKIVAWFSRPGVRSEETIKKAREGLDAFTGQTSNVTGGDSFYNRSVTWGLAVRAFRENPLFGIGPGTFGAFAQKQNPKYFENSLSIVNNEPLEILAEHGVAGLLTLILFMASLARLTLVSWQKGSTTHQAFAVGLLCALTAIAVQYNTFSTLYITHVWVLIGLILGIAGGVRLLGPNNKSVH